jgi:hypothetical protein
MIMVIHQTIGMAEPVIASLDLVKDFEKVFTILSIFKDLIFVISSAGNMINSTGKYYT